MIIHILAHGKAFCGKPGLPKDWEKEHFWVSLDDAKKINCPDCLENLRAYNAKNEKEK
jgi:hypothetical protein